MNSSLVSIERVDETGPAAFDATCGDGATEGSKWRAFSDVAR